MTTELSSFIYILILSLSTLLEGHAEWLSINSMWHKEVVSGRIFIAYLGFGTRV